MHIPPKPPDRRMLLAALAASLIGRTAGAQDRPRTVGPRLVVTPPLHLPALGRSRPLRIYLPPSYAGSQRRYPVLYLHDGQNLFDDATSYAGEWGVDETLDALATQGFEAIAVGIDHGGLLRMRELNPWDHDHLGRGDGMAYLRDLVQTIKPAIDAQYRTRPEAAQTALIGSSMGGLITHAGVHSHRQTFGLAGILSPSFWVSPLAVRSLTEAQPLHDAQRVFIYAGGQEGPGMVALARQYDDQLGPKGAAHQLLVWPEAQHQEAAWRRVFPLALRFLFQLPPG